MSTATEQQLSTRPVLEALSSGPAKRKRCRSSDSEAEDPLLAVKKKTLANGEAADSVATTKTTKEQSLGERVVILDAGAQYGKVLMQTRIYTYRYNEAKCWGGMFELKWHP